MAFDANDVATSGGSDVDFKKVNDYILENAGLQNRETLIGTVNVILDLGTQIQEDASMPFKGTAEEKQKALDDYPETYFMIKKDYQDGGKEKEFKCWPQKPVQCVALAIDFEDIHLDLGQFYGDDSGTTKPLRIWMGGQFWKGAEVGMVLAQPTALKMNKKLGNWSFDKKHLLHKMAVGSKLITPDECFVPQQIDELLGKSLQFEAQIYMKSSKSKEYFTEYVKYVSGLGRGQVAKESTITPYLIQFKGGNDQQGLKEIKHHVINTMKQAENWEASKVKAELEAAGKLGGTSTATTDSSGSEQKKVPAEKPQENLEPVADTMAEGWDDFDDDIPF
tara:strand:+ start:49 stop:1053 length:1005 start_codon:yes stop_codon:yes gene_type:complete